MKLLVRIVSGMLVLIVVAVTAVFAISHKELTERHDYPVSEAVLPIDSAALARGRHLATDPEIEALWMYIRSVPPRAFGEE